ncbi:hypothetical protein MES4922_10155 [Mesorhizobium ventifaucium]|uniref:Uncharacterized protein n=2 Tax=Mesorhizobium TaxID=68287 RepID=A0ABN8JEF1_9HYPH|nr:hypothetical protein MES4922_10155 [Mesorhizobium ventifaucium]CAH2399216.1 hypothetical protein MES5069_220051 [Mesorhizobium escarrei]
MFLRWGDLTPGQRASGKLAIKLVQLTKLNAHTSRMSPAGLRRRLRWRRTSPGADFASHSGQICSPGVS